MNDKVSVSTGKSDAADDAAAIQDNQPGGINFDWDKHNPTIT
jgi:hypothetical protein